MLARKDAQNEGKMRQALIVGLLFLAIPIVGITMEHFSQSHTRVEAAQNKLPTNELRMRIEDYSKTFDIMTVCDSATGNLLYVNIGGSGGVHPMVIDKGGCQKSPR